MLSLSDVLTALCGCAPGRIPEVAFPEVTIDSRRVRSGSLFFALKGEREDGHSYLLDALQRGAAGVVAERAIGDMGDATLWRLGGPYSPPLSLSPPFYFLVEDSLEALQRVAAHWRKGQHCRMVGVTGSLGKTTAKEVIWSVLSQRFSALRSEASYNSEIGLPLTLLKLRPTHERAILEMGMYALGEIRLLCQLSRPAVGVVMNVGPVHMERLGSLAAIARAKAELVEALPDQGVAMLNGDDPLVRQMAELAPGTIFTFGLGPENDLYADHLESRGLDGIRFRLHHAGRSVPVASPLLGRESIWACLAGAAVGLVEGLEWEEIAAGLSSPIEQPRLRVLNGCNGITIVDDAYNACPASTGAALEFIVELSGRRLAVLGDMRELGSYEVEGHRQVGRKAAGLVDILVAVGKLGRVIGQEAQVQGLEETYFAEDNAQALEVIESLLMAGDVVLVKGSRGMQMEEIVAGLGEE